MPDKKSVSRQIAKIRRQAGLTQTQLSDLLGVGVRTLSGWETAERVPKDGTIERIARICRQNAPEGANLGDLVLAPDDMGAWSIYEEDGKSEAEIKKPPAKEEKMLEKYVKLLEEKVARLEEDNVRLSQLLRQKSNAVGD